jgi:hypothetical protein
VIFFLARAVMVMSDLTARSSKCMAYTEEIARLNSNISQSLYFFLRSLWLYALNWNRHVLMGHACLSCPDATCLPQMLVLESTHVTSLRGALSTCQIYDLRSAYPAHMVMIPSRELSDLPHGSRESVMTSTTPSTLTRPHCSVEAA